MRPDVCATRCVHQSITGCNFSGHDGGIVWNHISEPSANHRDSQGNFSHAGGSVCFTAPASASNSSGDLPQLAYVQGKFTLPNTTAHATYAGTVGASVQYFGNPLGENNIFGASGEICASATCK